MTPGDYRRLDAMVAERVLGWVWLTRSCYEGLWLDESLESAVKRLGNSQDWLGTVRLADPELDGHKYRESTNTLKGDVVVPCYSADPRASKILRDNLAARWPFWELRRQLPTSTVNEFMFRMDGDSKHYAIAATEELAVVLCALKSVGENPEVPA